MEPNKNTNPIATIEGRVLPPILLWMIGVPGSVCLLLWLFFFRG